MRCLRALRGRIRHERCVRNCRIIWGKYFNVKRFWPQTVEDEGRRSDHAFLDFTHPITYYHFMSHTDVRKAVIPAAGLGTRFLPATKASPKEMLPLVDKPLIQYAVEEAVSSGIEDIIVVTGRGKRAIEDHFDRSVELEENLKGNGKAQLLSQIRHISNLANFCYVRQSEALGLGHAVLCAQRLIGDEPFAVILGDEIIDAQVPGLAQLIHIYKKRNGAVLGVQEVPHQEVNRYGIVSPSRIMDGLHRVT
ncbi:MAG TPA: UTP--glucose-1-phosphate uridylyltransferase, partial [Nitrospira sp.]